MVVVSMVIDEVYIYRLAILEAEDDPPIAGYAHAPKSSHIAL